LNQPKLQQNHNLVEKHKNQLISKMYESIDSKNGFLPTKNKDSD
jgi:hypothetical protein